MTRCFCCLLTGVAAALVLAGGCEKRAFVAPAQAAAPVEIVSKSGVEMVYMPGGQFMMGATEGNPDEAPVHSVTVSAFAMDKFPVTQEMFAKAQLPNPSHWQDPKRPVERVRSDSKHDGIRPGAGIG